MNRRLSAVLLAAWPPSRDNLDWPTALPYYLAMHAPEDVDIHLFYYRGNEKHRGTWTRDLAGLRLASMTELPPYQRRREIWTSRMKRLVQPALPVQLDWFPVRRQVLDAINVKKPDVVWFYPHWLVDWVPHLRCERIIVTGPDSAVLHNERVLRYGYWRGLDDERNERQALTRNKNLELRLGRTEAQVHMVGAGDAERFNDLVGKPDMARFTVHPHYDYVPVRRRLDRAERLRVFLNGNPAAVYMGDHVDRMVKEARETSAWPRRLSLCSLGKIGRATRRLCGKRAMPLSGGNG